VIPIQLGGLLLLKDLFLNNNKISGTIPSELKNLTQLQNLWLNNNTIHGPIPSELGNLYSLLSLNLSSNALSGTVPKDLTGKNLPDAEIYLYENDGLIGNISFLCENETNRTIYVNDTMKNVTCSCCVY